jgi:hypothetical protein
MELKLYDEDLRDEFKDVNTSMTQFKHFNSQAQKAVMAVGRGLYIGPRGDTHNAIYPPVRQQRGDSSKKT